MGMWIAMTSYNGHEMKLKSISRVPLLVILMILLVTCDEAPVPTLVSPTVTPDIEATAQARLVEETVVPDPTQIPLASNSTPVTNATSVPSDTLDLEKTIRVLKLQNFLLENLGPYDSTSSTFGDLKYDSSFRIPVFYEFGISRIDGQGNTHYNPTFEFKVPADTLVIAPISGAITWFEWQASANDWEIHIKPSVGSELILGIDHVVSIDCDRATSPLVACDSPLKIDGNVLFDGMSVDTGDVIGYAGHLSGYENNEINGKTELTVFRYLDGFEGTMNYCPTLYLDEAVENTLADAILRLMQSYEDWSGNPSAYDQKRMVSPGCLYKTIKQVGERTEPILE